MQGPTPDTAPQWSQDEISRLEWLLGTLEAKRIVGEALTVEEAVLQHALRELSAAEQAARESFGTFYLGLASGSAGGDSLPSAVSEPINRWVEARRDWDRLARAYLETSTEKEARSAAPVRTGPRVRASLPVALTLPTALPARDLLALLFAPRQWAATSDGDAIVAQRGETLVRVECDEITGLGPEQAIRQIAKQGASVAQTFFSLVGLWLERIGSDPNANRETYLSVYASDLLRYQQRKETPKGGYHASDVLTKGRDVYLLSRISVPTTHIAVHDAGQREVRTVSIGRLLSLESLEMSQEITHTPDGDAITTASIVRFRYHLGQQVHDWIGSPNQYAQISGTLLTYHPVRQKYQVLLGFTLACYDRANGRRRQAERRLSLPDLLNLAAIEIPNKRIAAFFTSIEEALNELSRDGVVPGLKLQKPEGWPDMLRRRDTRALIAGSQVTFPSFSQQKLMPAKSV